MSLETLLPIEALVFLNGSSKCNLITLGVVYTFFFFFGHTSSSMYNLPKHGSNPCPLQWKHKVLAAEPPGKSLSTF